MFMISNLFLKFVQNVDHYSPCRRLIADGTFTMSKILFIKQK